jgi:hypothetical protein
MAEMLITPAMSSAANSQLLEGMFISHFSFR